MRLDPHTRTLKIGAEINAERASREDESANSAVDEHVQAAGKLHRAEWSVQKALGEIQDISRGMREKFVDEKSPSYNDAAEHGGKKMPSESEMQQADECARDADRKEKNREAETGVRLALTCVVNDLVAFGRPQNMRPGPGRADFPHPVENRPSYHSASCTPRTAVPFALLRGVQSLPHGGRESG